jgi:hypothetical protein
MICSRVSAAAVATATAREPARSTRTSVLPKSYVTTSIRSGERGASIGASYRATLDGQMSRNGQYVHVIVSGVGA